MRTAVLTALKVQGYEVITTDPMIRTSPKLVAVTTAVSGDQYTAQAQSFGESVAWDVDVQGDEQSATLHATPRASVNGQAMDQVFYDWAQRTFTQLMAEIDRSLPTQH